MKSRVLRARLLHMPPFVTLLVPGHFRLADRHNRIDLSRQLGRRSLDHAIVDGYTSTLDNACAYPLRASRHFTGGGPMLTFPGRRRRFCDGISRRDFLRVGALTVGGLTLADLLRLKAQAGGPRPASP